jgi:outer membrane protein assembly factor BamB
MRIALSIALAIGLATPLRGQRVDASALPLKYTDADRFEIVGDRALVVEYRVGGSFLQRRVGDLIVASANDALMKVDLFMAIKTNNQWQASEQIEDNPLDGRIDARITAYRLDRGTVLWERQVRVQNEGGGPGARRLVLVDTANKRVFVGRGPLTALDLDTGKELWTRACRDGGVNLGRARLLSSGALILETGGSCWTDNFYGAVAVDGNTGEKLWELNVRRDVFFSRSDPWRPTLVPLQGGVEGHLLGVGGRAARVDLATGREIWKIDDKVGVLEAMLGSDLMLFSFRDVLYARSARNGQELWSTPLTSNKFRIFPADGDEKANSSDVLLVNDKGAMRIDRSTGQAVWTVAREKEGSPYVIAGGTLYLESKNRVVDAIDLRTGARQWRFEAGGLVGGGERHLISTLSPASTGMLLMTTKITGPERRIDGLIAVDVETGKQRWKISSLNGRSIDAVRIEDNSRIFASLVGESALAEIDPATGKRATTSPPLASYQESMPVYGAAGDCAPIYTIARKSLSCVAADGSVRWTHDGERSERSRGALLGAAGAVVFPRQDGNVEILSLRNGRTVQTIKARKEPAIGLDAEGRWVLVPGNSELNVLRVNPSP